MLKSIYSILNIPCDVALDYGTDFWKLGGKY